MNKTAIKNYATGARRKLMQAVMQKMALYGVTEKNIAPESNMLAALRDQGLHLDAAGREARRVLVKQVEKDGYQSVVEEVAYTWFNRLIAIRFMEVNDYLPSGIRMLSSVEKDRLEPDCVREWERLDFVQRDEAAKLKAQGDEALYRHLLIAQCNALGKILPRMFGHIAGYAALLLPDHLYIKDGIVHDLIHGVDEDDFKEQVEIIGWLYQYYISEKKDEVFAALKKNVKITRANIPAATQLFTPRWIVKYMVENSLGRLWMEHKPNSALREGWKYYIDEAEQTDEVNHKLQALRRSRAIDSPKDITFIDPCMGSGHILVYAFDLLYQIYLGEGYAERDIPDLILQNNLFGLDIDERACQLAYFALMMKARSGNRRFFRRALEEIPQPQVFAARGDSDLEEYGSALKVDAPGDAPVLPDEPSIEQLQQHEDKRNAWNYRRLLAKKYDCVVTNPPYMGNKGLNPKMSDYLQKNYAHYKSDTFSAFIVRCGEMAKPSGFVGMFTPYVWMFIQSYEKLRNNIYNTKSITSLIQFEYSAFEEATVPVCSFVYRNSRTDEEGTYFRLVDFRGGMEVQRQKFLEANETPKCGYYYIANSDNFKKIPGSPVAYWASESVLRMFKQERLVGDLAQVKIGMGTGKNQLFVREWWEVDHSKIDFSLVSISELDKSKGRYFPYNKGGEYRLWYGNNQEVLWFDKEGRNYMNAMSGHRENGGWPCYFKQGLTWSFISSSKFGIRWLPYGFAFDVAGSTLFLEDKNIRYMLGFLSSVVCFHILSLLNPTMNYQAGNIRSLPIKVDANEYDEVSHLVAANIALSRADWDAFETSWDFKRHPLVELAETSGVAQWGDYDESIVSYSLRDAFYHWEALAQSRFYRLKANEEELNRIFIDIYGLQDELTPEVEDRDVTVRRADRTRDIKSLISYAVGCMFGRYSLDEEGLAYAGGEWDAEKYRSFQPAENNILPITDADYFEDDIVMRFVEFIKVVYGNEWLENNLEYIAQSLYPDGSGTARERIRRYFLNDFYKDHVRIYQKRPIYWQFDSGKDGAFKALVYLHRYNRHTAARVRTEYLHPLQRKYEAEIERLNALSALPETTAREKAGNQKRMEVLRKKITGCRSYDQIIAHIAVQQIELDLDDGVVVNHAKFQGIEIVQGDGKPPLKMNLLAAIK